jgi:hypothetical protein
MLPVDDEALQSDVYLELLLDSHRRTPRLALPPTGPHGPEVARSEGNAASDPPNPELRRTAQLLDRSLIRFHPSFRFEEALAARLRAAADAHRSPNGPRGETLSFPVRTQGLLGRSSLPVDDRDSLGRVLVGGAIASGVSIAGAAAWLAWRRRSRQQTVA